jgi:hypothetical protein
VYLYDKRSLSTGGSASRQAQADAEQARAKAASLDRAAKQDELRSALEAQDYAAAQQLQAQIAELDHVLSRSTLAWSGGGGSGGGGGGRGRPFVSLVSEPASPPVTAPAETLDAELSKVLGRLKQAKASLPPLHSTVSVLGWRV